MGGSKLTAVNRHFQRRRKPCGPTTDGASRRVQAKAAQGSFYLLPVMKILTFVAKTTEVLIYLFFGSIIFQEK